MAAGGLTCADGGSPAGVTAKPPSPRFDGVIPSDPSRAGQSAKTDGKKQGGKPEQRTADASTGQTATGDEQSRKAQEFDAVQGRPPLGQQSDGKKESVLDVALRGGDAAAKVILDTGKEAFGLVNDAAGTVLHAAVGWTGISVFEQHAQRNHARGEGLWNTGKTVIEAVQSPVETKEKLIKAAKEEGAEIAEEWNAGCYGDLAERGGTLTGGVAAGVLGGGAATKILKRANGPDAPKAKGVSDSPKNGTKDAGKAEGATFSTLGPKAQHKLDSMYEVAPAAKAEIDDLSHEIAQKVGGTVAEAPLKSRERAMEKAATIYNGKPQRLTDIARNTIVTSREEVDAAVAVLRARGAKIKEFTSESNPLGYTGFNAVIETKAGIKAEIQVNTPEMIYAKEPESLARNILGDKVYDEIGRRTGIPGGQGHEMYEVWRKLDPDSVEANDIAAKSQEYYRNFR